MSTTLTCQHLLQHRVGWRQFLRTLRLRVQLFHGSPVRREHSGGCNRPKPAGRLKGLGVSQDGKTLARERQSERESVAGGWTRCGTVVAAQQLAC